MSPAGKKFFMVDPKTGKHHTHKGRGLVKHFPGTCNVFEMKNHEFLYSDPHGKHPSVTSFGLPTEVRAVSTIMGLVVVLYFDRGQDSHIVFIGQVKPKRGAWQNIDWGAGFHKKWDKKQVAQAINNFLWVADCEEARSLLPKKNYLA
jgi:hypothetical protein